MTRPRRYAFLTVLALAQLLPWAAADEPIVATGGSSEIVSIFSGDVHVPADVTEPGDVVVIGGKAKVEGRARNVIVILGDLELTGTVEESVVGVLTDQRLDGARIEGDYVSVLGSLEMRGTQVAGELVNVMSRLDRDAVSTPPLFNFGSWIPGLMALVFWVSLSKLLLWFLLIVAIVALVPERVRLIGQEAWLRYPTALLAGLVTWLVSLVVWIVAMATLCGIPLFLIVYWPLKMLGIAGLFFALGSRLGRSLGRELSVLGAVLGVFAVYGVLTLLPAALGLWGLLIAMLVRLAFFVAIELPALGMLVLTRLGTRQLGTAAPAPSSALAPPVL